jgi:hypothetical protein
VVPHLATPQGREGSCPIAVTNAAEIGEALCARIIFLAEEVRDVGDDGADDAPVFVPLVHVDIVKPGRNLGRCPVPWPAPRNPATRWSPTRLRCGMDRALRGA